MIWPTLCIDNFFLDPEKIRKYSSNLSYFSAKDGSWPGKRSEALNSINFDFHSLVTSKIISLLYPMNKENKITWLATSYFQKVDGKIYSQSGWVHKDEVEFTAIIYLSHHENCGTSIFSPIDFKTKNLHDDIKKENYLKAEQKNLKLGENSKELLQQNSQFKKTITFNSKFNRLILFDGQQYHAAEKFIENEIEEERLTLIIFFNNIFSASDKQLKFPISEMNRTNNL